MAARDRFFFWDLAVFFCIHHSLFHFPWRTICFYGSFCSFADTLSERDILLQIANSDAANTYYLDFSKLLDASEGLAPSSVVRNGGILFEAFILRQGQQNHAELVKYYLEKNIALRQVEQETLIKYYTMPFWFHLVTSIQKLKPKVGTLLFIWTLTLDLYGLSRFGIYLMGVCHAGQELRTYY